MSRTCQRCGDTDPPSINTVCQNCGALIRGNRVRNFRYVVSQQGSHWVARVFSGYRGETFAALGALTMDKTDVEDLHEIANYTPFIEVQFAIAAERQLVKIRYDRAGPKKSPDSSIEAEPSLLDIIQDT